MSTPEKLPDKMKSREKNEVDMGMWPALPCVGPGKALRFFKSALGYGLAIALFLGLAACEGENQGALTGPNESLIAGSWRARDTVQDPHLGIYTMITNLVIDTNKTYKQNVYMVAEKKEHSIYSEMGKWKKPYDSLVFIPSQCSIQVIATGSLAALPLSECPERTLNFPESEIWVTKDHDLVEIVLYKQ